MVSNKETKSAACRCAVPARRWLPAWTATLARLTAAWRIGCGVALVSVVGRGTTASALAGDALDFVSVPCDTAGTARPIVGVPGTVAYELVRIPGATWIRLHFGDVALPSATALRVTSLADGALQWLDAGSLAAWRQSSAYFNGDAVLVEFVARHGATGVAQIVIESVEAGTPSGGVATICGDVDDRAPVNDARIARMLPAGCTAFLIDDLTGCLLTAGHCAAGGATSGLEVAEFNVPPSDESGNMVHPPPSDQYLVDATSVQSSHLSTGSDWAYFGLLSNEASGLTARVAQDAWFEIDTAPPAVGSVLRINGFGGDDSPGTANFAPQTALGLLVSIAGTTIEHVVDSTGGNSGSPVINEASGRVVGVHTSGGCLESGGANVATGLWHPELEAAFSSPSGVCAPVPPLSFSYPAGKPQLVSPQGGTAIAVAISASPRESVLRGSSNLWVRTASSELFTPVPLVAVTGDTYLASLPPAPCGSVVEWFVTAASTSGVNVADPVVAPEATFTAIAGVGEDITFGDAFEGDLGWTVSNALTLTAGAWERAIPTGGGIRRDPPTDADGSGHCFLTEDGLGDTDLDGGWTQLTSPVLSPPSGSDPHVRYERWFNTSASVADTLTVEISNDAGATWVICDSVTAGSAQAAGGWFSALVRVADFVAPSPSMRVRFTVSDLGQPSVTEAGVDGFALLNSATGVVCSNSADVNGDGVIGSKDLAIVLGGWGSCAACSADITGDGAVDDADIAFVLGAWNES